MREVVITAVFLLPASRFKNRALRACGVRVHPDAHVGPNVVLRVRDVEIGHARIGWGNQFVGLERLHLDDDAIIGNLNSFTTAAAFRGRTPEACSLVLDRSAAVTSRHYFDCSGGIAVGAFSVVSGKHSDLLTHGIDDVDFVQDCAPIRIGDHARLGSANRVSMGSRLPDRSVTAMGTVVIPGLDQPGQLYAGVPATARKPVSGRWFTREVGMTPVRPAGSTLGGTR